MANPFTDCAPGRCRRESTARGARVWTWFIRALGCVVFVGLFAACGQERSPVDISSSPSVPSSSADVDAQSNAETTQRDTEDEEPGFERPDGTDRPRPSSDTSTEWNWETDADGGSEALHLNKVLPGAGPKQGGNEVQFIGGGFTPSTRIFVDGKSVEIADRTGRQIIAKMPPSSESGSVDVKVVEPAQGEDGTARRVDVLRNSYRYLSELRVDKMTPRSGSARGGTQVVFEGSGYGANVQFSFGTKGPQRVERISSEKVIVETPPHSPGRVDVRVTSEADSVLLSKSFEYIEALEVNRVVPASAPADTQTEARLSGKGFVAGMSVKIGQRRAEVLNVDPDSDTAKIRVPPNSPGVASVRVTRGDETVTRPNGFYFFERGTDRSEPELRMVTPSVGKLDGGQRVRLVGDALAKFDGNVRFGQERASVLEKTKTFIEVKTPPKEASGSVDVTLVGEPPGRGQLENAFEYRAVPVIEGISPTTGPVEGNTRVELEGRHLAGVEEVDVGGKAARLLEVSDSQVAIETPRHPAGEFEVVLRANGFRATAPEQFVFTRQLEVWGATPVKGSIAGRTYVQVYGTGFRPGLSVTVDGHTLEKVDYISPGNVGFYTPPHPEGTVEFVLGNPNAERVDRFTYRYFNPASRRGGASGGPIDGAINVSVFSTRGQPISDAFVMVSTEPREDLYGTTNRSGQITISTHGMDGPQTVTAAAAGFSTATFQQINSENLTIFLQPTPSESDNGNSSSEAPPSATIRGNVQTSGKLDGSMKGAGPQVVAVRTTQRGIMEPNVVRPGDRSVRLGSGPFELETRIGDLALIALCGTYEPAGRGFVPKAMGIERYITASDGDVREVDIACDIPLNRAVNVKIQDAVYAPDGPNQNIVEAYLDLGFEGVFKLPFDARGQGRLLSLDGIPAKVEKLSDLEYVLVGGSYTGDRAAPLTRVVDSGIDSLEDTVTLPPLLDVPEKPVRPDSRPSMLQFDASSVGRRSPHYYVAFLRGSDGRPFWSFFLPGTAEGLRIPKFPNFSFMPTDKRPTPKASSEPLLQMIGIRVADGDGLNDFNYSQLSMDAWRANAINGWYVALP